MGIRQRIGEIVGGQAAGQREIIQEVIGRVALAVRWTRDRFVSRTVDATQNDYAFWDRLQRGLEATYKLGGLFAKPTVQHLVSWSLGRRFTVKTDDEQTNEALARFVRDNLLEIMETVKTSKSLGDGYLVVNPDGTLTQVPPNQIEIETDPLDYRVVTSYTITNKLDKATVTDEYRLDGRAVTVRWHAGDSRGDGIMTEEVMTFPNVIGRLPVIHFPNERGVNELYGHSLFEPLLPLYAEYDDVLTNSLAGVKAMSNPIPTLEEVANPQAEIDAIKAQDGEYEDIKGVDRTQREVDMDDMSMIATSGKFNFKSPGSFTGDAWRMLKGLFYLMLQHVNIPEWLWGGHIESSNASVDAQLPAFTGYIDWVRMDLEKRLRELAEVWLATVALYMPGVRSDLELKFDWPELTEHDREVRLKSVQYARMDGMLTRERGLGLLDLVEDPEDEVKAADAEAETEGDEYDAAVDAEIERLRAEGQEEAA